MDLNSIKNKLGELDSRIKECLSGEMSDLKEEYLSELESNYQDEKDAYEDFDEFLEDRTDEHLEFALGIYLTGLFSQLDGELKAFEQLPSDEKDRLLDPYIVYFKSISEMGEI